VIGSPVDQDALDLMFAGAEAAPTITSPNTWLSGQMSAITAQYGQRR
jgi:hypothetical protein